MENIKFGFTPSSARRTERLSNLPALKSGPRYAECFQYSGITTRIQKEVYCVLRYKIIEIYRRLCQLSPKFLQIQYLLSNTQLNMNCVSG
jgi:hypothetical protein